MFKITVKEVRSGIKKSNMKLVNHNFFMDVDKDNKYSCSGCALTALYFQHHTKEHNQKLISGYNYGPNAIQVWANKKYDRNFVDGFCDGFDDRKSEGGLSLLLQKDNYFSGVKEGSRIRHYLMKELSDV